MLSPTISSSRYDAKRADTTGRLGLIDKVYIEWLLKADVVVADLTFANPNVYYELGIRHALSARGAVLIAQKGTVLPFDLRNQAILHYDLWDASSFVEFQQSFREAVLGAESDLPVSPVHVFMPQLFVREYSSDENPDRELARLRDEVERLAAQVKDLQIDRTQRLVDRVTQAGGRQRLRSVAHDILARDRVSVRVLEALAVRLRQHELYDDAIASLERAIAADEGDFELFRELGFSYRLKGPQFYEQARKNFETALKLNDGDSELHGMIGGMFKRQGDLQAAHRHYKRAYELDSEDLYSVVTMGAICAAMGAPEYVDYYGRVTGLCDAAILRGDQNHWTYFCRGESRVAVEGKEGSAVQDYEAGLSLGAPRSDIRSAAESLQFLADYGVQPYLSKCIQEQVLWPALGAED